MQPCQPLDRPSPRRPSLDPVQLVDKAGQIVTQATDSANPSGIWTTPMKITDVPNGQYTLTVTAALGTLVSQPASIPITVS